MEQYTYQFAITGHCKKGLFEHKDTHLFEVEMR